MTKPTRYPAASSPPQSSAVTIVICDGSISMCRRMSGNTPWPIDPKPMMTSRPGKRAWILGSFISLLRDQEHGRAAAPSRKFDLGSPAQSLPLSASPVRLSSLHHQLLDLGD